MRTYQRGNQVEKLKRTISTILPLEQSWQRKAQERLDSLTKPQGSLGRLEEIARRMVAIRQSIHPSTTKKVIFTLAGDHGVAKEGVSAYPQEVTAQMVYNFLSGGAAINVLARYIGAKVIVADLGVAEDLKPHPLLRVKKVGYGTKNMAKGPAMSRQQAIQAVEAGIELFEEEYQSNGIDIVGVGDMGIGNTTASSAIVAVLTGQSPEKVTGRGTGIGDKLLHHKIEVIRQAIALNRSDPDDPIDVLAKVGGFEIGGIAGVVLAAAAHRVPVIVDGFISTAGALIAHQLQPVSKEYMFAAHQSVEPGHKAALEKIGLQPLLDLNMRLGEGTGAALAMPIIEASIKILTEMATFQDAGVSEQTN